MFMRKNLISLILILYVTISYGQSSETVTQIQRVYDNYVYNLPSKVADENGSDRFRRKLEDFTELLDSYLKPGSGLSFEEMNQVRVIRSRINAMAEFAYLAGAERNCGWSEKRSLQIIQEIYPDISVGNVAMGDNACVFVIRVQIGEYVFYAGTHNESKKVKQVNYLVNYTSLHTAKGYCGIQANRYVKICDNAGALTVKYFTPKFIGCKIFDIGF